MTRSRDEIISYIKSSNWFSDFEANLNIKIERYINAHSSLNYYDFDSYVDYQEASGQLDRLIVSAFCWRDSVLSKLKVPESMQYNEFRFQYWNKIDKEYRKWYYDYED